MPEVGFSPHLRRDALPPRPAVSNAKQLYRDIRFCLRLKSLLPAGWRSLLMNGKNTFLVVLVFVLIAATAFPQAFRGGISGIVTDQTSAIVPGAELRAANEATGLTYTTTSSTAGEFSFADLPLGSYTVTASKPGFSTVTVNGVRVSAGTAYNLPVKMEVAQVASTVEVSAAALAVQTTETTLNTTVSTQAVQDLPINGRDFTQIVALSSSFSGYAAGANGSVDGTRANQLNWQIEGTDNNDQWWNIMAVNQGGIQSIPGVLLPLDSVEEFSMQTQGGPESGRNPGGTINLIIRSGTNQFHGSLYYYNRNEFLAAQSPFAPVGTPKNELRNQHFGGSFGGPIIKDKTFYFITYEEQKFVIGSQALATTPSLAYQQEALQLLQQYNVPVNPVSQNLLNALWPASSLTGAGSPANYFTPIPETGFSHNGLIKLDHSFNSRNRLSFRWFDGQGIQVAPVGSHIPYYYQVGPIHVQNYSVIYNSILSPTISNQVLLGVSYFDQVFSDANTAINPVALGLNTGVTKPEPGRRSVYFDRQLRFHWAYAQFRPPGRDRPPIGFLVHDKRRTSTSVRWRVQAGAHRFLLHHRRPRRLLLHRRAGPLERPAEQSEF